MKLLAFSNNVYNHLNIKPQWNLDKLVLLLHQLGHIFNLVNPLSPNIKFEILHYFLLIFLVIIIDFFTKATKF